MKNSIDLNLEVTRKIDTASTLIPIQTSPYLTKKQLSLILLICQNASVALLTRLSRTSSSSNGIYSPSVAVFMAEVIKMIISLFMLTLEKIEIGKQKKNEIIGSTKPHKRKSVLRFAACVEPNEIKKSNFLKTIRIIFWDLAVNQKKEILKLTIPAALYALQNTLLYTALSNLDAATYQTTYQLKLLSAAFFSVLFFKRHLSKTQWCSLFLLTIGVAIVQLEGVNTSSIEEIGDPRKGLLAILTACISSGLAGGWFEYILKAPQTTIPESPNATDSNLSTPTTTSLLSDSSSSSISTPTLSSPSPPSTRIPSKPRDNSPSLFARNLQLSVPSLCFSFVGILLSSDLESILTLGPLNGFTPLVWSVVINQSLGGLLVALVVREADGVAKGFATSIAIVLSTIANIVIFGIVPGFKFLIGAILVIIATVLFARSSNS